MLLYMYIKSEAGPGNADNIVDVIKSAKHVTLVGSVLLVVVSILNVGLLI